MAFAVWAISQGTSCSQRCVPWATKAFLFELSENSPSCPFTQEHSEPPVAIVVKVLLQPAPRNPNHPTLVLCPLLHTRLTGHAAQTSTRGLSSADTWAPLFHKCAHTLVMWPGDPALQLMQVTHTFLRSSFCTQLDHVCHCVKREGAQQHHIATTLVIPRGCSITIDSTNSSSVSLMPKKFSSAQSSIWQLDLQGGGKEHEHLYVFYCNWEATSMLSSAMRSPRLWERGCGEHGKM